MLNAFTFFMLLFWGKNAVALLISLIPEGGPLYVYGSPQWSPLVIAFAFRFHQTYLCFILEFVLVFYLKPQTLDSKISNLKLQAFLKLITLGFHNTLCCHLSLDVLLRCRPPRASEIGCTPCPSSTKGYDIFKDFHGKTAHSAEKVPVGFDSRLARDWIWEV